MFGSEPEKVVYFLRHGQSEHNVAPVFQSIDARLSEAGIEQAKCIAARASKISFDALISSPLLRTRETAEVIERATRKKPEYNKLFAESATPTSVHGKPYEDEEANKTWRAWTESLYTSEPRVEDGENYADILKRADAALTFLKDRPESSIMVVTHGHFLRTLVARSLFGDTLTPDVFRSFHMHTGHENTGLTILRYEAKFEMDPCWHLWIYNDHAHLG